jgi:hypothetical protein
MVGCKTFQYFGYGGQEGDWLVGFWCCIGYFAWLGDNYASGKFPGIREGAVSEDGIKEIGKRMWESQVNVSDDIIVDAIVTRRGGIIQVVNDIVDLAEGNWFVCSCKVHVSFDKGRW